MFRKKSPRFLVLLLAFFLILTGCRKKDPPTKSKKELLTASTWKFHQVGLDINNDGVIDTTLRADLVPVCIMDNMYTFKADSTAILDENINNCNPGNPRLSPFKWYFFNNETEIFISIRLLPLYEETSKIIELSEKRFVLSRQVGVHGFPSYLTYVIVMVH